MDCSGRFPFTQSEGMIVSQPLKYHIDVSWAVTAKRRDKKVGTNATMAVDTELQHTPSLATHIVSHMVEHHPDKVNISACSAGGGSMLAMLLRQTAACIHTLCWPLLHTNSNDTRHVSTNTCREKHQNTDLAASQLSRMCLCESVHTNTSATAFTALYAKKHEF